MQINKSVMSTKYLSQDELYILRTQIWQLYRARIYTAKSLPTTVADLTCDFDEDEDFKLHLKYKGFTVFSFDPKSKIIELDWEKFEEFYNLEQRGKQTLGWSLGAVFDQIYQEQAGSAQYVFETMTTSETRKMAKDFYGLLESTGKLSNKRMYNHAKFSVARRGEGWAVYDQQGLMVIHANPKFVHFGVGYITGTDINDNVQELIVKIRPHVLSIRAAFNDVRVNLTTILTNVIKSRNEMLKLAAGTLTQAARFDVNRFRKEYVHVAASGTKVFIYDDRVVLEAARGGSTIGTIELVDGKNKLEITAKTLDTLRENSGWISAIDADVKAALVAYSLFLTNQVTEFFEIEVLAKVGLKREQAKPYYEAFMKFKDRGFRGDFEAFATIVQPLKD